MNLLEINLITAAIAIIAVPLTTLLSTWVNYRFKNGKTKYCFLKNFYSWTTIEKNIVLNLIHDVLLPKIEKNDDYVNMKNMPKISINKNNFELCIIDSLSKEKNEKIEKHFIVIIQRTITNNYQCIVIPKIEFKNKKWLRKYGDLK